MKAFLTLLLLNLASLTCVAKDPADSTVTDIAMIRDNVNILSKTFLYVDSSSKLPVAAASNRPFSLLTNFKYQKLLPPDMIKFGYYLKLELTNSDDTANTVFLYPGTLYAGIQLYKISQSIETIDNSHSNTGYGKITLVAHENATILIYLKPAKTENVFMNPQLIKSNFLDNFRLSLINKRADIKIFGYIISGVLLMMILFMGSNYVLSQRPEFMYNALYSTCMFFLIYLNSYVLRTSTLFAIFFMNYFDFFLLVTGTIFYISFTRKFLNTTVNYVFLEKVLKFWEWSIFLLFLVYTYLNYFTTLFFIQVVLENVIKFTSLSIGAFFIIYALKQHNRLLNYLAAGNAALVVGSAISLGLIWSNTKSVGLFTSSLFYYYLGITGEIALFLLGMTYKNRSDLIERIKEQEAMKLYAEKKDFETQLAVLKAQQEERNRISADMHDDLGAGMTTIRLYSELAKNKLAGNSIPELDKISSSSDELLNKMNAIIWSMSSSNDSLGNMTAYIRSYALEYFENTGIHCTIDIPQDLPNIEVIGQIRRNVFLVVKEVLNNILKHAKATTVNITLQKVPDGLTLYIQDNGVGINFNELRQFSNGLTNMKKRMADVNIDFSIENKNGTLVTLHRKVASF